MRWTVKRVGLATLMVASLLAGCGEDAEGDLGRIAVSSTVLDIGADEDSIQFIVSNDGGEKVIVTFNSAKFSVDPDVISLQPGEDVTVTVRVRDAGEREDGSVTLTGDNGQTVRVGVGVEADESTKALAAEEFSDFLLSLPLMQRSEETEFSIEMEMWGFQLSLGEFEAVRVLMLGDLDGLAMDGQVGTVEVSPTDQPAQFQVDINWRQTFSRTLTIEEVLVATAEDLIPNRVLDIDRTETLIMSRSGNDLLVEGIRFKDSDE